MNNAVNVKEFENTLKITRKENRILYLGWYVKSKGVYDLVDSIEILVKKNLDIELFLYGTKEIQNLRKYVKQKKLNHIIKVHGWANYEEKIQAFHEATIFVLPSYTEGVPNVILEAMATKTPIISTNVGGIKELLVHNHNAMFTEVANPYDLSVKIELFLEKTELRKKLACQAYMDVVNNYDIKIIKHKFKKIINTI